MTKLTIVAALPLVLTLAPPLSAQDAAQAVQDTAYVAGEYRVFTGAGEPASIDDIVAEMGRHQVVFVGEAHDDPTGHMLEATLLQRAYETYAAPRPVVLSLEFFQRDVQPILDEYLADLISEKSFRGDSRPWPRYETDYRPLIEFAKENGIPVIAANAPRRYTTRVTLHGRESLSDLSPDAWQSLPPLPYGQPSPEYRSQWMQTIMEVMEEEGMKCGLPIPKPTEGEEAVEAPAPVGSHNAMGNQLHSQVLWDASMGYWISESLAARPDALVLHMVGGFHVARGTGTPEHLEAYRPGTSRMIVMLRPVENVEAFEPAPEGQWGDFVIQTDESRTLEALECRAYLAERAK
ncbi:MAG: ChaN family lipoprotein [Gemmatimonadota bacterium]|nr:ChaN family lipoprotein [Gemmatimonadota bacterium]MDH3369672.1 ChaN family lipoprotein [Gemmatimonadota bacterium]MDH3477773.1 ChaN family lipoprotein [Gemmatimonadota bacterium]MDH3569076.1 ChaN family lipoprotein [Gemmatimonadota bacterium]MDH5550797.1 ChaN family lipoprotein [Gemmatimonadota bacterium]